MTIADMIAAMVDIISDPTIAPFLGFVIAVGAAGQIWRRVARSAR
jgi:hypothetical protein